MMNYKEKATSAWTALLNNWLSTDDEELVSNLMASNRISENNQKPKNTLIPNDEVQGI